MMTDLNNVRGVIRGKVIELEDGQAVSVRLHPMLPPGEGIKQSAGSWADAGDELDGWLEEMRRSRRRDRGEPTA